MAPDTDIREPSDADLLTAVQAGDERAYGVLWTRHEAAARRLAAQLTRSSNVDDLVSEAFLRVLRAVKGGGGPDAAFRPYLFSTMRRHAIDTGRAYYQRIALTDDVDTLDVERAESAGEVYSATAEGTAALQAWESLPADSRTLLWHLVVEGETPAQVAPLLGVSANGVASRAVRAKERLRQAFLAQHLARADNDECRFARANLGAYVRNALATRDRTTVATHLDECHRCTAAVAELTDVNSTMRAVIAPLVLGGAAVTARYLAAAHHAAAAAGASGVIGKGAVLRLFGRARHAGNVAKVTAGAAVVVACAAVVAAHAMSGGSSPSAARSDRTPAARAGALPAASPAVPKAVVPRPSSRAAAPKHKATPSAVPTPPATTDQPTVQPAAAHPTRLPTHSRTRPRTVRTSPARSTPRPTSATPPPPAPLTTTVAIPVPPDQLYATIAVSLPAGWSLTNFSADGLALPSGGDGDSTRSWVVLGAQLRVSATGPRTPAAAMSVDVTTAAGTTHTTRPLN